MRSIVALAALALSGTLELAAASVCKPRPTHLTSATTDLTPTDTTTSSAASETKGPIAIKSVVEGGGFIVASADGSVPGFVVDGDAGIVIGPGYKKDGSKDSGCLSMKAENSGDGKKRGFLSNYVGVAQTINQLSLAKPYTVRFFYLIVTAPSLNLCQMTASLGGQTFFSTFVLSFGSTIQWGQVLEQVSAAQVSAPLSISMQCLRGGTAQIYVDSLFMSNQVTPATIDDHPLDLGSGSDNSDPTTTSVPPVVPTGSHTSDGFGTVTPVTPGSQKTTSVPPVVPGHTENSGANTRPATPVTPGTRQATSVAPIIPTHSGSSDDATRPATPGTQSQSTQHGSQTATSSAQQGTGTESASKTPTSGGDSSSETSTIKPQGPVSRRCANIVSSNIPGRGCGMTPYNSAGAYSRFADSNYQPEDCAALCLADKKCLSFEWSYGNNCANECRLIAKSLSDVPVGNTGTQFTSYDRSCIFEKPCFIFPADSICINKMGDTPNTGCTKRRGSLKSCAQSFATLTVQPCGGGDQCRDQCAMYPDCQSFSYNYLLQQRKCNLYAATTSEIVEDGGSEYFQDIGCYACGKNMGFATYALAITDKMTIPEMTCKAPAKGASDTSNTKTSQAAESTTTLATTTATEQPTTTTTKESSTATSAALTCPQSFSGPYFCQPKDNLPTQSVSLSGMGNWQQSDNDPEPNVQRTCNAFGVKNNGRWGRTWQSNHKQTTIEECAELCRKEGSNCQAFGLNVFDTLNGPSTCALSYYKLATDGIDIGVQWSIMWNDLACYECQDCQG
ncbi:hypothetical protein F53441_7943 [Fusarium austroafricanum]|uniref:Apple domain-containing protein n=1 Tax=Fusarium austroafricanum TaxID=2364996 RepID=A0A8H4KGH1_9HYPO|nr:hypothetical protein F53441_7943 [Fusarium austroafricanum]